MCDSQGGGIIHRAGARSPTTWPGACSQDSGPQPQIDAMASGRIINGSRSYITQRKYRQLFEIEQLGSHKAKTGPVIHTSSYWNIFSYGAIATV